MEEDNGKIRRVLLKIGYKSKRASQNREALYFYFYF